jgi:hypothetical protein
MTVVYIIYIVLFGSWLVLTLLFQLQLEGSKKWNWIPVLDIFSMVPRWTFFAPNPGQSDYHLLYRDIWLNGNTSNWKEVNIGYSDNYTTILWNPLKRKSKAIHDIFSQVIVEIKAKPDDLQRLKISLPYLMILNHVNALDHDIHTAKVQFMIMEAFGYNENKEPQIALLSDMHRLC